MWIWFNKNDELTWPPYGQLVLIYRKPNSYAANSGYTLGRSPRDLRKTDRKTWWRAIPNPPEK